MLDVIGRRKQTLICVAAMAIMLYLTGGLIKGMDDHANSGVWVAYISTVYGNSDDHSGIYGTIAVIFLFQGLYSFSITPMTSVYPTEISQYKLRTAGIAVFRFFDSGFGLVKWTERPRAMWRRLTRN